MIETTNAEVNDSTTRGSSESFSPESGGTSHSFRPTAARLLPEFERRPWWIAPGAVVLVPLVVMMLAAWAIPERIGSEDVASARSVSPPADLRSPSSQAVSTGEDEIEENVDTGLRERPHSLGRHRSTPETSVRPARRGFSPVREREDIPPPPPPPPPASPPPSPIGPQSAPEPPIARSNAARGGEAVTVVPRPDEPPVDSEAEPAVAVAPEGGPQNPGDTAEGAAPVEPPPSPDGNE